MTITPPDLVFSGLVPEIVVVGFATLLMVVGPFFKQRGQGVVFWLTLIGLALAAFTSILLWNQTISAMGGMAYSDNFATFFRLVFLLAAFVVVLFSKAYLKWENLPAAEYYSLLLFSTFGMMLMAGSLNLIVIFLGLEVMSIPLYILAGYRRSDFRSIESSMKYFLIGAFASGFLLYGIALIYGAVGSTDLEKIAQAISSGQVATDFLFLSGVGLLLVGFGFKVASVPFHMWTPDVYEGAPTAVTGFMAAGPKAAGFAALLRVFSIFLAGLNHNLMPAFWILSVLTMTTGNVIALSQPNLKRMLAYSSIAHAGYILVALVAGGEAGIASALFYLLAYSLMNLGAFACVCAVEKVTGRGNEIASYAGLASRHPLVAIALTIFLVSLGGLPPTAGFVGKFYVFSAAVNAGQIPLVIIAVLNSLISVYYYLRPVVVMFMQAPEAVPASAPEGSATAFAWPVSLALSIFITAWGTLQLGIFPQALLELARQTVSAFL